MIKKFLLAAGLLFESFAYGFVPPYTTEKVDVIGAIDFEKTIILPALIRQAGPNLTLLIDSTGGLLDGARAVTKALDERRSRGLKTTCVALKAMSAAFIIFAACDERYAVPYGERYMSHYPYLATSRVTLDDVEEIRTRLYAMKKEMDKWADDVFKGQGALMRKYMAEEKMMTGKELCQTFIAFCHVSYVLPVLE